MKKVVKSGQKSLNFTKSKTFIRIKLKNYEKNVKDLQEQNRKIMTKSVNFKRINL